MSQPINRKDSLEDLVERFIEEKPADVEGFLQRYPEHVEALRKMLPAMLDMEVAARTLASGSPERRVELLEKWRDARERLAAGLSLDESSSAPSAERTHDSHDFVRSVLTRLESPEPPRTRYESQGEIARGGQGVVLAVWDETLRRHLAMKVALAPADARAAGTLQAISLGRFLEEAQVTARLDHPGIVPVHDLGLDAERRVYFTMKLVKGRDLRSVFELVRTGEEDWTRTRALNVLLKVCEAMAYAHSKGVIHRDLKPSNVMVGRFGEVYVMDWGLARVVASEDKKDLRIRPELTSQLPSPRHESDELDSPLVTMDGDVVGTPAYMPPEQARGEIAAMGPHSDVYAVGAMLYQLLTGQMPYVPADRWLSNHAIWALVQKGPPDPVHALAKDVPAELVAICERAMARDAAARYADMGTLAEDLRAYLEGRVVRAYEAGALAELRKWVRRNRRLTGTIAAALVAMTGLTVVYVRHLNASNLALDAKNLSLRARGLASASLEAASSDSMLSLLLAREAVRVEQTPETLAELHRAVGEVRERVTFDLEEAVFETAFSPRGDVVLTVSALHATLWDLQGKRLARLDHVGGIRGRPLFSAAGDWILTASLDGTARRWDLQGRELTRFEHGNPIWSVAMTADERHVVTGSADGVVKLWEREGRLVTQWKAHEAEVLDLALSPGGELLVTGGADSVATLWSLSVSERIATRVADLAGHSGPITFAQFSPGGDRILTVPGTQPRWISSRPGWKAWLWDREGALITTLVAPTGGIEWAGFSPDGERILSFSMGGATQLWDREGKLLASGASGTRSYLWPGEFAPAGDRIVGPSVDGTVWLFDSALQIEAGLLGHGYEVISAHFSPDGRHVLTGSMDKTAKLWDARPLELPEYRHGGNLECAAYSPDGRLVVTASEEGPTRIWNVDGSLRSVLRGHQSYVKWAGFSPDGRHVLTASDDKTARLWTLEGNELRVFAHEDYVVSGGFSSGGERIVTGGRGNTVIVWDVERALPIRRIEALGGRASSVAFLADDERILVAAGTTAAIYTPDGKLERSFGPHDNWVDCAEISPAEDTVLTTAAGEPSARLWSVDGSLLRELEGHDAGILQADFSPDGKRVVTASLDKTARVWDLEGHVLSILRGHRGPLMSAVFSPDGRRILTASFDGTARTWMADTGELLEFGDRRAIRDFTPLELARYGDLLELPGREARKLVEKLRSELILKDRIVAHLEEAQDIDVRVRECALRMAGSLKHSARDYNSAAWMVIRSPDASAEDYAEAQKLVEAACELEPDDANIRNTHGFALYRCGRFAEAVELLTRPEQMEQTGVLHAWDMLALALSRFRLGQPEEARAALSEARALLDKQGPGDGEALLREAEELSGATDSGHADTSGS